MQTQKLPYPLASPPFYFFLRKKKTCNMKIGLFFGSFNPIHVGHLIIAETVADRGGVDQVWLVVSPQNPFKKQESLLHEHDRLHMVRLAIGDNPRLNASDIEFRMPKPSYTIDTLAYLSDKFPQHEFKVIVGEDNLLHFHKWKNHERILEYYGLLVYPRPHAAPTDWLHHERVQVVEAPQVDISATFIRESLRKGFSIKYLVHPEVEAHIKARKLFV